MESSNWDNLESMTLNTATPILGSINVVESVPPLAKPPAKARLNLDSDPEELKDREREDKFQSPDVSLKVRGSQERGRQEEEGEEAEVEDGDEGGIKRTTSGRLKADRK